MPRGVGPVLIVVGFAVIVLGVLIWSGALSWFGRLPGDVRVEGERTRVYVPIVSLLLVSVVLTIVINLLGRWWR